MTSPTWDIEITAVEFNAATTNKHHAEFLTHVIFIQREVSEITMFFLL